MRPNRPTSSKRITDEHEKNVARAQLRQIMHYAESAGCRRSELLEYFGETFPSGQLRRLRQLP